MATCTEHSGLVEKIGDIGGRLKSVEKRQDDTRTDIHGLHDKINGVNMNVSKVDNKLSALSGKIIGAAMAASVIVSVAGFVIKHLLGD